MMAKKKALEYIESFKIQHGVCVLIEEDFSLTSLVQDLKLFSFFAVINRLFINKYQ